MNHSELDRLWADPAHWGRTGYYDCAADPRLFVPKRAALGWTVNLGHPKGWLFVAAVAFFIVAVLTGIAFVARAT